MVMITMVESGSSNTTKISMQVVGWKIPTFARQNLATQTHCFERNQDSLADHIQLSSIYLCCPVKLPSKKKQCLLPQNPKSRRGNLWKKNDVGKNGRRETRRVTGVGNWWVFSNGFLENMNFDGFNVAFHYRTWVFPCPTMLVVKR